MKKLQKDKRPQAPQVGHRVYFQGSLRLVNGINPDNGEFDIEVNGRLHTLSGDDWDVWY